MENAVLEAVKPRIRDVLLEGEEVLWGEKPVPTIRIDVSDSNLGLAGAGMLLSFIGFLLYRHSYFDGTFESFLEERVYGVALICTGVLIAVLTYYAAWVAQKNTCYLLTNKRLFFIGKRKVQAVYLFQIDRAILKRHGHGLFTIKANPYSAYPDYYRNLYDDAKYAYSLKRYLFEIRNIREGDMVLERIEQAKAAFLRELESQSGNAAS